MAVPDTLCGWGQKNKAAYFLENADIIVPHRREQLALLLDLFNRPNDAELAVLDLGSGFGAVTEQILARFSRATVTCVDGSTEMMALARDRLASYGARVRFYLADLANPSWSAEMTDPCDVAVSALAIHHLSDDRKRGLYRELFKLLRPSGIFLNNDICVTPDAMKDRFEELNLKVIQDQDRAKRGTARPLEQIQAEMHEQLRMAGEHHQSHIATLRSQLEWLVEAGFKSVDCYWKYLDLAIFGGVKE
jgi:tRNA (cmo5U34)-methyltransferase